MSKHIFTIQEVEKLHYDMWMFIAKSLEKNPDMSDRWTLKRRFINSNTTYGGGILHACFCCEYAEQKCAEAGENSINRCKYCPAIWGNEETKPECFCERDYGCTGLDWFTDDPKAIANVEFKTEGE